MPGAVTTSNPIELTRRGIALPEALAKERGGCGSYVKEKEP